GRGRARTRRGHRGLPRSGPGSAPSAAPISRLPITLWRCVDDMADVDRFAAPEVDHLPSAEPRGADGAHFLPMAHDALVPRSNLGCCVDRTDSEDVALRGEVLDVDPVPGRGVADRTARA